MQSKGLSRVFSNTTVQKHQFFSTQLYGPTLISIHDYWKKNIALTRSTFVGKVMSLSRFVIRSVTQSCPTLCDPMNRSMPGLPVHHQLPEFTQTHIHRVSDAIQPSHPLLSPSPPAFNLSQHQSLSKCVSSSHQVAKVLQLQLQHQSFQ